MKSSIKFLILIGLISSVISCESKDKGHGGKGVTLTNVKIVNEQDPVCEMPTAEHLKDTLTYEGKLYGFCSSNCKEEFKADPKKFLKKK